MTDSKCREVEDLLRHTYPTFTFACALQSDGQYQISLASQITAVPQTIVVGITAEELRTPAQVRNLGLELINCFAD
ncbi:hypothetical protein NK553_26870 [Pseudomonas sp. ZM23]|uniref:Uncharacterized protein n=1 Tax=Pseudomonas triclosanedens TaxID=2961893 RepID=A0ABY7A636_9PSED|nr:hypothetical protein [Pseudomonas triclosanedens]MCP8467582.1 hypothetical protein [Pseudomonas triclosanedens]MCP8471759.1 hypothetical protein [Pseudomonas triclosanedens]MCP8478888.1 hypothetical protein [Pseudomonas triclosanedens]WAI52372.1 hypothetical protein OU419_14315 [Pseudomonas triclosanedens]